MNKVAVIEITEQYERQPYKYKDTKYAVGIFFLKRDCDTLYYAFLEPRKYNTFQYLTKAYSFANSLHLPIIRRTKFSFTYDFYPREYERALKRMRYANTNRQKE